MQNVRAPLLEMIDLIETEMTSAEIEEAQAMAQVCLSREFRNCGD